MSATRRGLELLRARGLAPKKSFGQHFLHDARIVERIAALATDPPGGTVLEIGAGVGALTEALAARAGAVVAVERDRDLVPILRELFASEPAVEIVEADAVKLAWDALLAERPRPHVVAGNLPYQLTGRLLERAVRFAPALDAAVFMMQREVAQRIESAPGSKVYGALSVFVQAAFSVERALTVAPGAFVPPPEVDSTVVMLRPHAVARALETPGFRAVVKSAFSTRRKTLRNAWRALAPRPALEEAASQAGVDLDARAENLAVEDFARMAAALAQREPATGRS